MKRRVSLLSLVSCLLSLVVAPLSRAQATDADPIKGLYFNQNLGSQIPLDLKFKDEAGKDVKLQDYFNERPVVLALVFYNCQSSCLLIKEGLLKSIRSQKKLTVGQDFDVLVVSINHKEDSELAAEMKKTYVDFYNRPGSEGGFHLLTGTKEAVHALTQAVGFGFIMKEVQDPETKQVSDQIMHPSGIIILTPEGVTSLYMLGAKYPAEVLRRGVIDARSNKIGPKTETILLGCFMYDAKTGKYRLVVENALKIGGIGTALILFGSIALMSFRYRRSPLYKDKQGGDAPAAS